jgi:hypothetical protein
VFGTWNKDNRNVITNCHLPYSPIRSPITSFSSSNVLWRSTGGLRVIGSFSAVALLVVVVAVVTVAVGDAVDSVTIVAVGETGFGLMGVFDELYILAASDNKKKKK